MTTADLIQNLSKRTGYSEDHCWKMCATLTLKELRTLSVMAENPATDSRIERFLGLRDFLT